MGREKEGVTKVKKQERRCTGIAQEHAKVACRPRGAQPWFLMSSHQQGVHVKSSEMTRKSVTQADAVFTCSEEALLCTELACAPF